MEELLNHTASVVVLMSENWTCLRSLRRIQLREKGGRATTSVSEMGEFIETLDVVAGEKGF